MKNIELTKRSYSKELLTEFPNSLFLGKKIYDDAIIGVTKDNRIVYDYYRMEIQYHSDLINTPGYDYKEDFQDEDDLYDYVSEMVSRDTYTAKDNAPIYCTDEIFLTNVLPVLQDFDRAIFQDENEE